MYFCSRDFSIFQLSNELRFSCAIVVVVIVSLLGWSCEEMDWLSSFSLLQQPQQPQQQKHPMLIVEATATAAASDQTALLIPLDYGFSIISVNIQLYNFLPNKFEAPMINRNKKTPSSHVNSNSHLCRRSWRDIISQGVYDRRVEVK